MADGTDAKDTIEGTKGNDVINALAGNDEIYGSDGHDTIDGGAGGSDRLNFDFSKTGILTTSPAATHYTLTSTRFSDNAGLVDTTFTNVERFKFTRTDGTSMTFDGSAWNNGGLVGGLVLEFGSGNDNVIGSQLNDSIIVESGINVVDGGAGTDQVRQYIDSGAAPVTVNFNGSSGTVVQNGVTLLTATNIEQFLVGNLDVTPSGGTLQVDASSSSAGVAFLDSPGDDIFIGTAFDDYITTVDGLSHSLGHDVYYGGAGNDIYDFITSIQGLDGTTIMDFAEGDLIDLSFNDGVLGASKIKADIFIGMAAFSGVAGEVRYAFDSGTTLLTFDSNGDKAADGTLRIASGQWTLESFASTASAISLGIRIAPGSSAGSNLTGGAASDTLTGSNGPDTLSGGDGNDVLIGGLGADQLIGGPGIDTASYAEDGGAVFVNLTLGRGYTNTSFGDTYDGIENVIGSSFNDFIIGDTGVNRLDGGAGDDTIVGAVGPDEIIGGIGIDLLSFEDNSGTVFVNLLTAKGYNNAAQGDTFSGIENVIGGLFDDTLIGDDGANRLDGAMGADTLVGNGGADTFVFRYAPGAASGFVHPNSSANVDTIFDFVSVQDKLEINAAGFGGGLTAGSLAAGAFVLGTAAGDADDRFIYDQATGKLYFDADGSGAGAQVLMAVLPNHDAILASDFVIV